MALTEKNEQTIIVSPDGSIRIRDELVIERDGVEISRTFHSKVIDVEDDISNETPLVKDIADKVRTREVISARRNQLKKDDSRR